MNEDGRAFIHLFLGAGRDQQKALLYTVSRKQTEIIGEIFHNLDTLSLNRSKFSRFALSLIVKLTNKQTFWKKRARLIQNHWVTVSQILMSIRESLKRHALG